MSECSGPDCDHPSHKNDRVTKALDRMVLDRNKLPDKHQLDELKKLLSNMDYAEVEKRVLALATRKRPAHLEAIIRSGVTYAVTEWMATEILLRRQAAIERAQKIPLKVVE